MCITVCYNVGVVVVVVSPCLPFQNSTMQHQQRKEDTKVELCDICGDRGFPETLVTCTKCHVNREHCYCMRNNTLEIPIYWLCESCGVSNAPRKVNQNIAPKMQRAVKTGKVKYLPQDDAVRLRSGEASVASTIVISKIPSLPPKRNPSISSSKVLGKLSGNEVHRKMTIQHASCPLSNGGILVTDAECNQPNAERNDLKSVEEISNLDHKFLPSYPTWKGQLQFIQFAASRFEARPPCIVNRKAYIFSKEMPSVLQLKSLPALNVLTDIFQDDSPKLNDVALYFLPSENTERSRKNLNSLLNFLNDKKSMLRSYINGVELLVFTSNQLDMNTRGVVAAVNSGQFLWGTFRPRKIDKAVRKVPEMEPVDMDIDMIGGKDLADRVDHFRNVKRESDPFMNVPPGFDAHA
ncbi:hypothetical protein Fmac_008639 [Flemingia macrophylla]|uniref:AIPP2-like SPOC-like domain-containing protein n=1 Tax=Flemingia macrophylla TaxID=520843 RepID=A0ABD1MXX9_9FABA